MCQAHAVAKLLPIGYTLQIDRTIKNKKPSSKRKQTPVHSNKVRASRDLEDNLTENEPASQVAEVVQAMSYSDMIRRAQKIVGQLRKNKNSWPFLEPVDPIAMGIPQYREIVKDPMDLKTVGNNIREGKYLTITQFYADIELMIKNSYLFNKSNPDFIKLTEDF